MIDAALLNHGVGAGSDTCIQNEILHIFQAAGRFINQIFTFTGAVKTAGNRDFVIINGKTAVLVINRQGHFSKSHRLTELRARKNDVFHFRAAQHLRTALAKHPADGIGNITFSASVRSDNTRHTFIEINKRAICKRFEPENFNFL